MGEVPPLYPQGLTVSRHKGVPSFSWPPLLHHDPHEIAHFTFKSSPQVEKGYQIGSLTIRWSPALFFDECCAKDCVQLIRRVVKTDGTRDPVLEIEMTNTH